MQSPRLYATFLLWLLSELFERLPEVGDPEKPKFVFFFDEAHLLFDDAPKALLAQDRAGGAAHPLQRRRRLLHHPEPARHPGVGAGPARQPRAARAARLHAARPEGGEDGGGYVPPEQEVQRRRPPSPSWASARRWSPSSTPRARPSRSSAASSRRRAAASVRRRKTSAPPSCKASPLADKYDTHRRSRIGLRGADRARPSSGQVAAEKGLHATATRRRRGQYDATPPPTADTPPAWGPVGPLAHPADGTSPPTEDLKKPRLREAAARPLLRRRARAERRRRGVSDTLSEAYDEGGGPHRSPPHRPSREATKAHHEKRQGEPARRAGPAAK